MRARLLDRLQRGERAVFEDGGLQEEQRQVDSLFGEDPVVVVQELEEPLLEELPQRKRVFESRHPERGVEERLLRGEEELVQNVDARVGWSGYRL